MAQSSSTYRTDPAQELANWRNHRFAAMAEYEKILNERGNELLSVNEKCGPMSEHYKSAKENLQKAQREFERIHSVIRRPLNKHRVRWIYFAAFAFALALLEAPVNKYLFDVALNGSSFVSYTVSVAFAFFVLVLAHVAGRSIRQVWSEYPAQGALDLTRTLSPPVCCARRHRRRLDRRARVHFGRFRTLQFQRPPVQRPFERDVPRVVGHGCGRFLRYLRAVLATVNIGATFMT